MLCSLVLKLQVSSSIIVLFCSVAIMKKIKYSYSKDVLTKNRCDPTVCNELPPRSLKCHLQLASHFNGSFSAPISVVRVPGGK